MFVSLTRLRIRSLRFLPSFLGIVEQTVRQLVQSPGFHGGKLLIAGPREFWTVTLWTDESGMRQYRSTGAHLHAMGRLAHWCDEASVAHWIQPTETAPDWEDLHRRMRDSGRRSKVNRPSRRHAAEPWIVPPPRWRLERSLAPKH